LFTHLIFFDENVMTTHVVIVMMMSLHKQYEVSVPKRPKKDKETNLTIANSVFAETTHVVRSKSHSACEWSSG